MRRISFSVGRRVVSPVFNIMSPATIVAVVPATVPTTITQVANQSSAAFRPGDWNCPGCKVHNFRNRSTCFACNSPKPDNLPNSDSTGDGGRGGASFDFKPGDWKCSCGQHNFRRRTQCMACNKPRPDGGV